MINSALSDDYNLDKLMQVKVYGFDFFVTPRFKGHYADGSYEELSMNFFKNQIRPGDTVIDIGAHYGIYTLVARRKVGDKGRVISFEPAPINNLILQKNIKVNGYGTVEVRSEAVSDSDELKDFNITEASDNPGFSVNPNTDVLDVISVTSKTIDSMYKKQSIHMMKIDAEGHEIEILRGASGTIASNPSMKLLVEFNPKCLRQAGHDPMELIKILSEDFSFDVFGIDDYNHRLYRVNNSEALADRVGSLYINLLCIPKAEDRKIILLSSHTGKLSGGGEKSLLDIAQYINSQGHLLHMIFPDNGSFVKAVKPFASYDIIPSTWWAGSSSIKQAFAEHIGLNLRALSELEKIINSLDPDVAMTNCSVNPWLALACSLTGTPHAWFIREFGEKDHKLTYITAMKPLFETINNLSGAILVNSSSLANYLKDKAGVSSTVIYPGFDDFPVSSKKKKREKDNINLLIFGAITKGKGQLDAIVATKKIIDDYPKLNIRLTILGKVADDSYFRKLKKYVRDNDLSSSIIFKKHVPDPTKAIDESDIILVCSEREAFGRVVIEAQLRSRPVIASSVGGIVADKLIINDNTGLLYESGNTKKLISAIDRLINDPILSDTLAQNGNRSAIKRFHVSKSKKLLLERLLSNTIDDHEKDASPIMTILSATKRYHDLVLLGQKKNKDSLLESITLLSKKNDDLQTKVNALGRQLNAITNSNTWKYIVKPVDKIKRTFSSKERM